MPDSIPQTQTVKRYYVADVFFHAETPDAREVVLASDYEALRESLRKLERDWKEKCIEADTMRQHHKNAEASLREQEERNEKLAALVKEEWVSGAAWVYNTAAQGQWRDATKAVEARWPESSTAAKLAALSPNPSP